MSVLDDDFEDLDDLDEEGGEGEAIAPAPVHFNCDVLQVFDFDPDTQVRIGHITALKIGTKEFPADFTLKSPMAAPTDPPNVRAVAAIDTVDWGGGALSPMTIVFRMSKANRAEIPQIAMRATTAGDDERDVTKVEIAFAIYEYDSIKHKYYKALHTGEDVRIKGVYRTADVEALKLCTIDEGGVSVEGCSLTFSPEAEDGHLHLAFGAEMPIVKEWGKAALAEEEGGIADMMSGLSPEVLEKRRAAAEKRKAEEERRAKLDRRKKQYEALKKQVEALSERPRLERRAGESETAFRQRIEEHSRVRNFELKKLRAKLAAVEAKLSGRRGERAAQQFEEGREANDEIEEVAALFGEGGGETATEEAAEESAPAPPGGGTGIPAADLTELIERLEKIEREIEDLKRARAQTQPQPRGMTPEERRHQQILQQNQQQQMQKQAADLKKKLDELSERHEKQSKAIEDQAKTLRQIQQQLATLLQQRGSTAPPRRV
jgi:hypothetical protein